MERLKNIRLWHRAQRLEWRARQMHRADMEFARNPTNGAFRRFVDAKMRYYELKYSA